MSGATGSPVRPLVISHGTNSPRTDRTRFRLEFDWGGTGDPTPYLSIPAAFDFMSGLLPGGWSELQAAIGACVLSARAKLLALWAPITPLAPESMIGSLAAVDLPPTTRPPLAEPTADADEECDLPARPAARRAVRRGSHRGPGLSVAAHARCQHPRRRLLRVSAQLYNDACGLRPAGRRPSGAKLTSVEPDSLAQERPARAGPTETGSAPAGPRAVPRRGTPAHGPRLVPVRRAASNTPCGPMTMSLRANRLSGNAANRSV